MKPNLKYAIEQATVGLKNAEYFLQDPALYSFDTYLQSCADGTSRKEAESEWRRRLIPNLNKSSTQLLSDTGIRLERAWQAERDQRRADHQEERSRQKRVAFLQAALDDHREAIITHSTHKLPGDLQELLPIRHIEPVSQRSRSPSPMTTAVSPVPFPQHLLSSSAREGSQVASPPSDRDPTLTTFDNAVEFFGQDKALQDVVLDALQEGDVIPSWARDRPAWRFSMSVGSVDYGPTITTWYNDCRVDSTLDFHDVDKIALLSGILHLYDQHHALDKATIAAIRNKSLESVYTTEDEDKGKAKAAAARWNQWMVAFRSLMFEEQQQAQKEGRDARPVSTSSLVKNILSSYDQCEQEGILPVFFAGLNTFRRFNNWKIPRSEMSWTTSVVLPIIEEFMFAQHEVMFTCANSSTSAGKKRKVRAGLKEQPCQPDVIGLADEGESEVYYGEIKLSRTGVEEQNTDRLRIAIFSKDALDHFERTLERAPPVVSFQVVGRKVVFFFAVKIDNTILHCKLSSFSVPVTLEDLDLHEDVFFPLFQVQSLVKLTKDSLDKTRKTPLTIDSFPTMGTPNRRLAMDTAAAGRRGEANQVS
ncbi:hypothetical protein BGZ99_008487 [Dissophora globulifera]|uniref:Uncharacterized protein n=1 Tax=Dissophora globulifera TaxID=979702 RepID=A0A9P6UY57_9FUNG|nr:hypothetical protein BGZ99_008487 [Dissophora globulifera]